MSGANYLGGGVTNLGKPAEYYEVIDQRKKDVTRTDTNNNENNFAKILKNSSINKTRNNPLIAGGHAIKNNLQNPNKIISDAEFEKNGTNFALKKLSKEMEAQLYGMFWVMIDNAREVEAEGGFAEKMFRGAYITEVVKNGSDPELGEVGRAIYNSFAKEESQQGGNGK